MKGYDMVLTISYKNTMKTKEEIQVLKEELKKLNAKLAELTEDELKSVIGGNGENDGMTTIDPSNPRNLICGRCGKSYYHCDLHICDDLLADNK